MVKKTVKNKSEVMQEPHRFLAAARKQWGPPLPPAGDPKHYPKLAKTEKRGRGYSPQVRSHPGDSNKQK